MTSYDVIVVGARVAGSATALLLDQLQATSKAAALACVEERARVTTACAVRSEGHERHERACWLGMHGSGRGQLLDRPGELARVVLVVGADDKEPPATDHRAAVPAQPRGQFHRVMTRGRLDSHLPLGAPGRRRLSRLLVLKALMLVLP